jgi:hypothetical protein
MERPSGLGRSLEDVLDSLTPADADPSAPGRVHFEPEDLEQQLDSLMGDIRELRDRVQHLVGLVPDDEIRAAPAGIEGPEQPPVTKPGKKQGKKAKQRKLEQHGAKKHKKAKKAKKHKKDREHRQAA